MTSKPWVKNMATKCLVKLYGVQGCSKRGFRGIAIVSPGAGSFPPEM